MTISSVPPAYSITSSDTITLTSSGTLGNITIGSGTGSSYYYTNGAGTGGFSTDTITISNGGTSNWGAGNNINTITTSDLTFNWNLNEEFVNCLPDFDRIQKMCKEYPGLKIAYEKFVTTYKLVKDHYDTPEDQRPKP